MPDEYQCPECGLSYDAQCRSYYSDNKNAIVIAIIIFAITAGFLIFLQSLTNKLLKGIMPASINILFFSVVFILFPFFIFIQIYIYKNKKRKMPFDCAISIEGFHYWQFNFKRKTISWMDIKSISYNDNPLLNKSNVSNVYVHLHKSIRPRIIELYAISPSDLEQLLVDANRRIVAASKQAFT